MDSSEHSAEPVTATRREVLGAMLSGLVSLKVRPQGGALNPPPAAIGYYEDPNYKPFVDWIRQLSLQDLFRDYDQQQLSILRQGNCLDYIQFWKGDFEVNANETTLLHERRLLEEAAQKLAKNPPELCTLKEIYDHPLFKQTLYYKNHLAELSPETALRKLFDMARAGPEGLQAMAEKIMGNRQAIQGEIERAMHAELSRSADNHARSSREPERRCFGDMAAARKAGGYPIPSSVSEEQQKRLDIGIHTKPHASGCEYYGTIDGQERGKFQS